MEVLNKGWDIYEVFKDLNNEVLNYLYCLNYLCLFLFILGLVLCLLWFGDILIIVNNIYVFNFVNVMLLINIECNLINYLVGKIGYEIKLVGGVFVFGGLMVNLIVIVVVRDV